MFFFSYICIPVCVCGVLRAIKLDNKHLHTFCVFQIKRVLGKVIPPPKFSKFLLFTTPLFLSLSLSPFFQLKIESFEINAMIVMKRKIDSKIDVRK